LVVPNDESFVLSAYKMNPKGLPFGGNADYNFTEIVQTLPVSWPNIRKSDLDIPKSICSPWFIHKPYPFFTVKL
jgi:hypothetical protein